MIIAEAGVNHNGDIEIAKKLIKVAAESGADAVKFQTFKAELSLSRFAEKAAYQKASTNPGETQLEMSKSFELPFDAFAVLRQYCDTLGIEFMSTPGDFDSIEFLLGQGMKHWKVSSAEITNLPFLTKMGSLKKPIIMSTGMCTMPEIEQAIQILKGNGTKDLTVLHCTTEYPAPFQDVNLRAMQTIRDAFGVNVGYSDHTKGIEVPVAAVALGATVIEKHFTLDNTMEGPDHSASLEPDELKDMVSAIRNIEQALGNGQKQPAASEIKNINIARKSIVAQRDIKAGEILTVDNLAVKRPGDGINPMKWFEVLGQTAKRDFVADELIEL